MTINRLVTIIIILKIFHISLSYYPWINHINDDANLDAGLVRNLSTLLKSIVCALSSLLRLYYSIRNRHMLLARLCNTMYLYYSSLSCLSYNVGAPSVLILYQIFKNFPQTFSRLCTWTYKLFSMIYCSIDIYLVI